MSVRPAVWQRLPDIAPNYGKLGRNRKMLSVLRPSRESEVITRDNVCQANQLSQRLSTIQIERSRTMRLLNTGRQTFIAKQTIKQRNLERAGITDVSLLTPGMLLQAAAAGGDTASTRRQQLRRRSQLTNTVADIDDDDDDDVFEKESTVCSLPRRRGSNDVENKPEVGADAVQNVDRWNRRNVGQRFVSSAVGAATTTTLMEENGRRDGGVPTSDVAAMYRSRTMPAVPLNAASSFMTHNFSKAGQYPYEIVPEDDHSNSSTLDPAAAAPTDVINDRRFQSLVKSLSPCTRCDSFIQLSPSGVHVLETYSSAPCDMERLRRAIAVNGGTARLRYAREKPRGRQTVTRRRNANVLERLERSPLATVGVGQLVPVDGKPQPFFGTSRNPFPKRTVTTAE